jgi:hypothetical protein
METLISSRAAANSSEMVACAFLRLMAACGQQQSSLWRTDFNATTVMYLIDERYKGNVNIIYIPTSRDEAKVTQARHERYAPNVSYARR